MRSDNRLSRMLHVLLHMAQHEGPVTSEVIAHMLGTNPVVVRRTMAGLRDEGYVQSEKGHGGGWVLSRKLEQISLFDVYRALGEPPVFALGLSDDHPHCLVEQAVNAGLEDALRDARALLMKRFAKLTLADLARDVEHRSTIHLGPIAPRGFGDEA
jgi:Rrf2 family protein